MPAIRPIGEAVLSALVFLRSVVEAGEPRFQSADDRARKARLL
jgi:hypothetical protein